MAAQKPTSARGLSRQREADIGAEHIEGAMREIDDARDAEDNRQARGDQEQRTCARQSGEQLIEVEVQRSTLAPERQVSEERNAPRTISSAGVAP
jgi:hypothetical protein